MTLVHQATGEVQMGSQRAVAVSAGLVGVLLLTVAGCATASGSVAAKPAADTRAGTVETFLAADRPAAPPVTGELLDGSAFDLAAWRGKVMVVNFWGSWCAPCRAEARDLEATYRATRSLGVEFVVVDVRDAATAFVTGFGITYPTGASYCLLPTAVGLMSGSHADRHLAPTMAAAIGGCRRQAARSRPVWFNDRLAAAARSNRQC